MIRNTFGEPLKHSICLSDEDEEKLKDFVSDLDGKDRASLQFIVLEGDCVLFTIERFITWRWDKVWNWHPPLSTIRIQFSISWFHISKYDESLAIFGTTNGNMEICFRWIKQHVSPYGVLAVEDSDRLAKIIEYYPLDHLSDQFVELYSTMKKQLNRNINLESLTKRVIRGQCVDLDKLDLPRKIVDYLKQ